MDDFNNRQLRLFQDFIFQYRNKEIELNTLVQRLEGLRCVISLDSLSDQLEPVLCDIEVINAVSIENNNGVLSTDQAQSVNNHLAHMEGMIQTAMSEQE